jgi:ATP-dependent RNA helicase SUPV3L1/SUV3
MVATDAIGMGLNMDVAHVAFSSLRKFDGADHRGLSGAEVAQIAGRAGRHTRDGTFGPTHELEAMPADILLQVEAHAFPPLRRLWWRSRDLDLDSVDGLRASLLAPPPSPLLQPARNEDDALALEGLLARRAHPRRSSQSPPTRPDPSGAGLRELGNHRGLTVVEFAKHAALSGES